MGDVRLDVVRRVIADLPARFDTYAVLRHPVFVEGHDEAATLGSVTGRVLSQHAAELGIELADRSRSPALWRKLLSHRDVEAPARPARRPLQHPVRTGHWEAVRHLATEEFRDQLAVLLSSNEVGGVFVRATDRGVCVVDLHGESHKPLIGVGRVPYLTRRSTVDALRRDLPEREAYLREVRQRQSAPSPEGQYEAALLRHAVAHGLRLPEPFPSTWRVFAQQWRLGDSDRLDLLCVDLADDAAVVVELKPAEDAAAAEQARRYAAALRAESDRLGPFMTAYLRAMSRAFGADDLDQQAVDLVGARAAVAWPRPDGGTHVEPVPVGDPPPVRPTSSPYRGIGPQYAKDTPFTARMRLHQSWWRDKVLQVSYGRGPSASSTSRFGNMLDDDGAERLLNFLTDDVRRVYLTREGPGVEPFRARRNLLSSQPMCFNLFGQLAADLDLAGRVLQRLLPDVGRVTDIRLEWAPTPASEYLADRTSFDAAVDYVTQDGVAAFLGLETKLTEPFSPTVYDTARYRELTESAGSPWPQESWPSLADARWNQLWRNHLLVEAHRRHPASGVDGPARLGVVHHPADVECTAALTGYTALVRPGSVVDLRLDLVDQAVTAAVQTDVQRRWWADFHRRYVDLSESGSAR